MHKSFSFLLILAVLLALAGTALAYTVKERSARFSATCGEALVIGDVAALNDSTGYAFQADADNSNVRVAVGVVGKGCASGGTAELVTSGILSGWSALAEGSPGYLSTTAGDVTQTAPAAWQQQVAVAISATAYKFDFMAAQPLPGTALHSYANADADWTLTATETQATYLHVTLANDSVNAILPVAIGGKMYAVYNNSGAQLTLKVTGQTGATVNDSNYALFVVNGNDTVRVSEQ